MCTHIWRCLPDYFQKPLRRREDSNPRYPFGYSGFRNRCFQPLSHASTMLRTGVPRGLVLATSLYSDKKQSSLFLIHRATPPRYLMLAEFTDPCKIWYSAFIFFWPYRLTVRTQAFQAWNRGSIPRRVIN